ncbi:unnamed protein product [Orchesella dallaii]|uniref:C2H2-type domain-containing protein n=1 Tax=Orchesella dallaii TaxID=48710 RepID=A0ABP1PSI3_9HEXA
MLEVETEPLYKCEMSENNCLFCAISLPPTFTVVNGQVTRLKKERDETNDENDQENLLPPPSTSSLTSEDFILDKQLQVIFILRNILHIPEWKLSRFLKKFGGQLHPEFWIRVCSSCEREVHQFYKTLKALSALRKRLTEISSQLKAHIYTTKEVDAEIKGGDGNTISNTNTGIWREIRGEVLKDFEEIPVFLNTPKYHEDTKFNIKSIRKEAERRAADFGEVESESSFAPTPEHHFEEDDEDSEKEENEEESCSDSESESQSDSESQSNSEDEEEYKPKNKRKLQTKRNFKSPPRKLPKGMSARPQLQTTSPKRNSSPTSSLSPSDSRYLSQYTTIYKSDSSRYPKLRYKCNLCSGTQHCKSKIQEHLSYHQSGQGSNCSQCGMFIPTGKMKYHIAAFHIERQSHKGKPKKEYFYFCSKCPARYRETSYLKEHHELHRTKEDCTPCKKCGWLLKNKVLRRHMTTHHNSNDFSARINKPFRHHRSNRPPRSSSDDKKKCIYHCENCPAKYKHKGQLRLHNLLHDKDQPESCSFCEICGWLEKNKMMRRHFLNYHEEMNRKEEEEEEKEEEEQEKEEDEQENEKSSKTSSRIWKKTKGEIKDFEEIPVLPDGDNTDKYHENSKEDPKSMKEQEGAGERPGVFGEGDSNSSFLPTPDNYSESDEEEQQQNTNLEDKEDNSSSDSASESDSDSESQSNSESDEEYTPKRKRKLKRNFISPSQKRLKQRSGRDLEQTEDPKPTVATTSLSPSDPAYLSQYKTFNKPGPSRYHKLRYQCNLCSATQHSKSKIQEHLSYHQNGNGSSCSQCGMFIPTGKMKYHIAAFHIERQSHKGKAKKEYFYFCSKCPARYRENSYLKLHIALHRTKEDCTPCQECGWLLKNKFLRRHMTTHHNTRDFSAEINKSFSPNRQSRPRIRKEMRGESLKDFEKTSGLPNSDNDHEDSKLHLLSSKQCTERGVAGFDEAASKSLSPHSPPSPANHSEPEGEDQDSDQKDEDESSSDFGSESESNSENEEECKPKRKLNYNFKSLPQKILKSNPRRPMTQSSPLKSTVSSLSPSHPDYLSQYTTFHKPGPSRHSTRRYQCNLCSTTQQCKPKIQKHLSYHQSGNGSNCSQCEMFIPTGKMKYHIAAFHIERQSPKETPKKKYYYFCSKCPARFRETSILKEHLILHETNENCAPCEECGWLIKIKSFRRHMKTHHNISDFDFPAGQNQPVLRPRQSRPLSSSDEKKVYIYYCESCPAKYKETGKLRNHNLLHEKDQPVPCSHCEICGWLEKTKLMRRHFLNYHEEKKEKGEEKEEKLMVTRTVGVPYYCDHCPMIYTNMGHLQRHFVKHHVEKFPLVPCEKEECQEKFESRQLLLFHLKKSHGKEDNGEVDNLDEEQEQKCPHCELLFNSKMKVDFHIAKKHRDVLLTCKTCNIKHNNYQSYRYHMETTKAHATSKSYFCELCGKAYWDKDRLKVHRRQEHFQELGLVPISCPECGKILSDKLSLEGHIKTVHRKERDYACEFCGKTFARPHNLEKHLAAFHKGSLANPVVPEGRHFRLEKKGEGDNSKEEKWLCDFCPVIFPNLQQVRTHLLSQHYDELKHCCEGCGKRYCASMGLHKHRKTCSALKSEEDDAREKEEMKNAVQFSCEFCTKTFNHREAMSRHRRRVHRDRYTHKCNGCGKVYRSLAILLSHRIDCCEGDDKGKDVDAQPEVGNVEGLL